VTSLLRAAAPKTAQHKDSDRPLQVLYLLGDETLPNFKKKKAPKKGREKETKGKDQSPGKQMAQKRCVHVGEGTTKYPNLH
jgi:hypothetical protein